MPILKHWKVDLKRNIIIGDIYEDDRFEDGTTVYTSTIINADFEQGIVQTRNTLYELDGSTARRVD